MGKNLSTPDESFDGAVGYTFSCPAEERRYGKWVKRVSKTKFGKLYISQHRSESYNQGYANGQTVGRHNGLTEGKAAALKEAAETRNTRDTLLKAAEVQTAAMECLTRLVSAIANKV